MTDKQYLEAVAHLAKNPELPTVADYDNHLAVIDETNRRLSAIKAQEDNIKSEMWKEKKS